MKSLFDRYPARQYVGIGTLTVATPRGEVKAQSGDWLVDFPTGAMVFDPVVARDLFFSDEEVVKVRELKSEEALAELSIREQEDMTSPTMEQRFAELREKFAKNKSQFSVFV